VDLDLWEERKRGCVFMDTIDAMDLLGLWP
jgi:hypothetical protein